jgi:type I restriction enzyme S subunit
MSDFGLRDSDIEKIQKVFASYGEVKAVILYGSRAKGNFKPYSDIDLTLSGEKINPHTQFSIETDLDDLLLPYKIDLSIFQDISNPDLVEHINRIGKYFYRKYP